MRRTGLIVASLVTIALVFLVACGKEAGVAQKDQLVIKVDPANDKVAWSVRAVNTDGPNYDLVFHATIDEGWWAYSVEDFGEMGPLPSLFEFDTLGHITIKPGIEEKSEHTLQGYDAIFDMEVKKFKHDVDFVRHFSTSGGEFPVTGHFVYSTCNDEMCLPPATVFWRVVPDSGTFQLSTVPFDLSGIAVKTCADGMYKLPGVDLASAVSPGEKQDPQSSSLLVIFFLGFIGGLVALLTPCVFPMIPLTVSFFTKGSTDKRKGLMNALTYGAFIFLIYAAFSIPFHLLGSVNPEIFNEISTNPWLNIAFFVIFIVFSISFLGYFEITLPSSWVNRMDSNASKFGGGLGIFFMALTLALVSFSCTGPILGSLLAGALSSDGGAWQLTMGLSGFGFALALPFALFAMFPGWLNNLPKSGGWLDTVKKTLGFVELALAVKFFSNADLVMNWGLLPREIFIGLWILIGLGLVFYLIGRLRLPHDVKGAPISKGRWTTAALAFAFVLYLMPGLTSGQYRNLKLLSGFPPPLFYSLYHQETECPLGLTCYHTLEEGRKVAHDEGKIMMIDFTGWACVNCRKMEETVWSEPEILGIMKDKVVLVSLYVDDKRELPNGEQHVYIACDGQKKFIQTIGNQWATLESESFKQVSQPLYVLLSPEGKLLTDPVGYTPDVDEYAAFFQRGLQGMEKVKGLAGK
ncbi:MAG: cytochrome c biogenesis protein CcdA [Flavobacteriales bacterium]